MHETDILEQYKNSEKVQSIAGFINSDEDQLNVENLHFGAQSFVLSAVSKLIDKAQIIICYDKEEAAYLYNDIDSILDGKKAFYFPESARIPYQTEKVDNANVLHRTEVLGAIQRNIKHMVIVSYPEALSEKIITRNQLSKETFSIKTGENISRDFLNEFLLNYHFRPVDYVLHPGEFSIRGSIIDVFSYSNDFPYRIDFFDDKVDQIKAFDPSDQLSRKTLNSINIIANIGNDQHIEKRCTLFEFLGMRATAWITQKMYIYDRLNTKFQKAIEEYNKLPTETKHLQPNELFYSGESFLKDLTNTQFIQLNPTNNTPTPQNTIQFNIKPQPSFHKDFNALHQNIDLNHHNAIKTFIFSNQTQQLERLYKIFEDQGFESNFLTKNQNLHAGFIDQDLKLACYTDHQIFERFHRFRLKEGFKKSQQTISISELSSLKKGDYIVHIDHGIGIFDGLEIIDNNGKNQEAIRLIYQENDLLYVSIHSLHRVSKYANAEGKAPKVHKLGSKVWQKIKSKTKARVKEVAFDLIQLYAQRKSEKGFAFTSDTYLQTELEASFEFEDTPDQSKATIEVKKDMESASPMDRLICGDVGFGKTEIAIRAAFKAVADGKQVAILAPTTILTLQHYRTFKKRLQDFPCTIAYINRFKSRKAQTETLKSLKEGQVDILIGTHRIIGKDVHFKDLGLLIIDEEQKFGVGVKDKLKTIKTNVDTLTLTATPIPRTLQFSLMNARDMSVIQTPPPNRQPVQTQLHGFNEEIIRDAIRYETARSGQVFFIHNRVQNIKEVAGVLQRLCPEIRVGIVHGQLDAKKLEDTMMAFMEGDIDVLVATSIVESGLDIPNANTIIINQAHNFGLSDLHQMRGRVGRSNKKGFCLLLCPPLSSLSSDSRKRIQAILQFSDLGSGINIAMRDLDIRGAGDLLGADQSGFIADIGIETYQKILNEALQELKQNQFKELFQEENNKEDYVTECQVDTDLEIMLPNYYVEGIAERIKLYRHLSNISKETELHAFKEELIDRFGELPTPASDLLKSIQLKWLAMHLGFEKIILKNKTMLCYFIGREDSPFYASEQFQKIFQFVQLQKISCVMKQKNNSLILRVNHIESIEKAFDSLSIMTQYLANAS